MSLLCRGSVRRVTATSAGKSETKAEIVHRGSSAVAGNSGRNGPSTLNLQTSKKKEVWFI
jgi:hypothetical protein